MLVLNCEHSLEAGEDTISFDPQLILDFNQHLRPLVPILSSIGTIPPPSESQTGIPFDSLLAGLPDSTPSQNLQSNSSGSSSQHHPTSILSITSSTEPARPKQRPQPAKAPAYNPALSRKREEWLSRLKITYTHDPNHHEMSPNYPKVGDSFPSIEKFKESCLWASWKAGHDMHVKNHYKTEAWERCVFTCRYDRSPPKGYNCPFRITASYDKLGQNTKKDGVWTVIQCLLSHQNHEITPGVYDPSGKRPYRKHDAEGSIGESSRHASEVEVAPKKRGRPQLDRKDRHAPLHPHLRQQDPDQEDEDNEGEDDEIKQERLSVGCAPYLPNGPPEAHDPNSRPRRSLARYNPVPASCLIDGLY